MLCHHAQCLTTGVDSFAAELRGARDGRRSDLRREGDLDAAHDQVASTENAELFLYPGQEHLFADSSLASYQPAAAALLTRGVLEFLDRDR